MPEKPQDTSPISNPTPPGYPPTPGQPPAPQPTPAVNIDHGESFPALSDGAIEAIWAGLEIPNQHGARCMALEIRKSRGTANPNAI
jgi:hypothetical protein